jgi:hypothetical protein
MPGHERARNPNPVEIGRNMLIKTFKVQIKTCKMQIKTCKMQIKTCKMQI